MARRYDITGSGGVRLSVCEYGDPEGPPILFLHGYAQSRWCWSRQVNDPALSGYRLVTFDHRGHGRSDKPDDPRAYNDSRVWAQDVAAVIDQAGLAGCVIAAWSYSGLILCDYLRAYGDMALTGINLVAARTLVGNDKARAMSGTLFLELVPGFCSQDAVEREAAVRRFLEILTAGPIPDPDFYTMLGFNLAVPPHVCAAMLDRRADNDEVLAKISVPVLLSHGDADTSVLLAMAEHNAAMIARADLSVYADIGHAPFYEDAPRFNRELATFVSKCTDVTSSRVTER
ncbi:MAG: alpha/beta hydrolase [Rhodospirillaceae bacterium]|nr:alpha/beta hydrolase [Rhodospirillaceae bacterium]